MERTYSLRAGTYSFVRFAEAPDDPASFAAAGLLPAGKGPLPSSFSRICPKNAASPESSLFRPHLFLVQVDKNGGSPAGLGLGPDFVT